MAKRYTSPSSSGSARGYSSGSNGVSQARLSQKTGSQHSFGGYMKLNHGNGSFSMKKTGA